MISVSGAPASSLASNFMGVPNLKNLSYLMTTEPCRWDVLLNTPVPNNPKIPAKTNKPITDHAMGWIFQALT